jgi:SAM-dependent methyltransferase
MELTADLRRQWYELERRLADELRASSRDERARAYEEKYETLYTFLRSAGYLQPETPFGELTYNLDLLVSLVQPRSRFLEIGSGTGTVALAMAKLGHEVVATEIAPTLLSILHRRLAPLGVLVLRANALTLDVPGLFDVVYSNDLIEHLHEDDTPRHLNAVHRHLRKGGRYIIVTPNRYSGPHDISAGFSRVARGFHLKEWTYRELERILRAAGFTQIETVGVRSHLLWKIANRARISNRPTLRTGSTTIRQILEPGLRIPMFRKIASVAGASAVTLIAVR